MGGLIHQAPTAYGSALGGLAQDAFTQLFFRTDHFGAQNMVVNFRWRALIAAVRNAWPVWLALGGIAIAFLVGWKLSANDTAGIRYAGTVLQVLGLATVAVGLSDLRRLFGKPSFSQKVLAWLRQIWTAFRSPKPSTLQIDNVVVETTLSELSPSGGAGPGASLDYRVAILEENLNRLRDEFNVQVSKIRKELGAVHGALDHEQRAREAETSQMAARLEELAVGGLHLESVGLLWLVFGVLGTSIPDEIAKLLQALSLAVV